ncbi:hypothetical protein Tco_0939290 [Tanacetum coccineum]|uniref:Uncharacterized protein n=1 Tax=Tanacetum coccineum TaxID=301880 RepID=A0ABQ5DJM6_9ASTR
MLIIGRIWSVTDRCGWLELWLFKFADQIRYGQLGVKNIGNGMFLFVAARQTKEKGCCLSSDSVADCSKRRSMDPTPSGRQASTSGTQTGQRSSMIQDGSAEEGGTVDQHPATVEETRAYFESLYNNLALEVEKVNSVNQKMKEIKADLTTELARYKIKKSVLKFSQKKLTNLKMLSKVVLSRNNVLRFQRKNQLVSSLLEEKKKLKSDFKIREDELLDKQIQLENKIKELDNILVKTGQSIQTMHMLSPKPDSFYHTEQKMALGYQNPFYLKQAQRKHKVCTMAKCYLKS